MYDGGWQTGSYIILHSVADRDKILTAIVFFVFVFFLFCVCPIPKTWQRHSSTMAPRHENFGLMAAVLTISVSVDVDRCRYLVIKTRQPRNQYDSFYSVSISLGTWDNCFNFRFDGCFFVFPVSIDVVEYRSKACLGEDSKAWGVWASRTRRF